MSADIEKVSIFDDRIVQQKPRYAVEKGALSLTNSPFRALAATSSQQTYQIQVPSLNVFVDRAIEWTSQCFLQFTATPNTTASTGVAVCLFGRDVALSAFPLHSLVNTMTATINDTSTTINLNDVLWEVLRLTDYKKNRAQRTCPTYLDTYQSYASAYGAINNPIGGYELAVDSGSVPNGAWGDVTFTTPAGVPLADAYPSGSTYTSGGVTVTFNAQGIPLQTTGTASYPLFVRFTSTEKLVMSPFVFSDCHEWDTGIFGVQNIQLIMNTTSPSLTALSGRCLRTNGVVTTISALGYNANVVSPFGTPQVNVQFLTPSLDLPLPQKSVVPYMEFPRYVLSGTASAPAFGTFSVQSQTITLPQIPDLLILYCKPQSYSATDGDWYYPFNSYGSPNAQPISINLDNFSGLLSSQTAQQLYAMCVRNGLDLPWSQWSGKAKCGISLSTAGNGDLSAVATTGGFLVLKPSQDVTLQSGQAPSLVGNFTFQFNATFYNPTAETSLPYNLYTITANSGFFETIRGSSRIIKGVLTEADIISAPMAGSRSGLTRWVGGKHALDRMGNVITRVRDMAMAHLPQIKAVAEKIKPLLPQSAQDVLTSVGLGHHRRGAHHRLHHGGASANA